MIGLLAGIVLILISLFAIPLSKKSVFGQRYGRLLALVGVVVGILVALLFAWKGL